MASKLKRGMAGCAVLGVAILAMGGLGVATWSARARGAASALQQARNAERAKRSQEQTERLSKAVDQMLALNEDRPDFIWRIRRRSMSPELQEEYAKVLQWLDDMGPVRHALVGQDWSKGFDKRNDRLFAAAALASTANSASMRSAREGDYEEALRRLGQALELARVMQEHPTVIGASIGAHSEIRYMRTVKFLADSMPRSELTALAKLVAENPPVINPREIWEGELLLALGYYDRKQEWLLSESCTEPILRRLDLLGSAELAREEALSHWEAMLKDLPEDAREWEGHLQHVRELEDKIRNSRRGYVRNLAFDRQGEGASTYDYSVVLLALVSAYREGMQEALERLASSPTEYRLEIKKPAPLFERGPGGWFVEQSEVTIELEREDVVSVPQSPTS